jgi:hypothetical protein
MKAVDFQSVEDKIKNLYNSLKAVLVNQENTVYNDINIKSLLDDLNTAYWDIKRVYDQSNYYNIDELNQLLKKLDDYEELLNDYITKNELDQLVEDNKYNGYAVLPPSINNVPVNIEYGNSFTLNASGGVSAFKSSGATIVGYEWILPDNSLVQGNSITYNVPNDPNLYGTTISIGCRALDNLNNKSKTIFVSIPVVGNQYPIIDSLQVSSDDITYNTINNAYNTKFNESFYLKINASDPDLDNLTYSITVSNDPFNIVSVTQDQSSPNKFLINIGSSGSSTYNPTLTIIVSDGILFQQKILNINIKKSVAIFTRLGLWNSYNKNPNLIKINDNLGLRAINNDNDGYSVAFEFVDKHLNPLGINGDTTKYNLLSFPYGNTSAAKDAIKMHNATNAEIFETQDYYVLVCGGGDSASGVFLFNKQYKLVNVYSYVVGSSTFAKRGGTYNKNTGHILSSSTDSSNGGYLQFRVFKLDPNNFLPDYSLQSNPFTYTFNPINYSFRTVLSGLKYFNFFYETFNSNNAFISSFKAYDSGISTYKEYFAVVPYRPLNSFPYQRINVYRIDERSFPPLGGVPRFIERFLVLDTDEDANYIECVSDFYIGSKYQQKYFMYYRGNISNGTHDDFKVVKLKYGNSVSNRFNKIGDGSRYIYLINYSSYYGASIVVYDKQNRVFSNVILIRSNTYSVYDSYESDIYGDQINFSLYQGYSGTSNSTNVSFSIGIDDLFNKNIQSQPFNIHSNYTNTDISLITENDPDFNTLSGLEFYDYTNDSNYRLFDIYTAYYDLLGSVRNGDAYSQMVNYGYTFSEMDNTVYKTIAERIEIEY